MKKQSRLIEDNFMKITNLTNLAKEMVENNSSLPQHWDDSIIQMRRGDLDWVVNCLHLANNKIKNLELSLIGFEENIKQIKKILIKHKITS